MTKNERQVIQEVCDYFEYHNKNCTREQDYQIDRLRELLVAWKQYYSAANKTENAVAARAKYYKKYKRTHKKHTKERHKEYYLANRERIREQQKRYREKKLSQLSEK